MSPNVPNIIVPRQLVLEPYLLLRVGTGEEVMDEIYRHGEMNFERFEVKEQIGWAVRMRVELSLRVLRLTVVHPKTRTAFDGLQRNR